MLLYNRFERAKFKQLSAFEIIILGGILLDDIHRLGKNIEYIIFKSTISDSSMEIHSTYGISLLIDGKLMYKIDDVCLQQDVLERFVLQLNQCNLSPIHLIDVVDDFLAT
ncbi:MAG: DUF6514 family protein [Oscillospiraceae bacterium]